MEQPQQQHEEKWITAGRKSHCHPDWYTHCTGPFRCLYVCLFVCLSLSLCIALCLSLSFPMLLLFCLCVSEKVIKAETSPLILSDWFSGIKGASWTACDARPPPGPSSHHGRQQWCRHWNTVQGITYLLWRHILASVIYVSKTKSIKSQNTPQKQQQQQQQNTPLFLPTVWSGLTSRQSVSRAC